MKVWLVQMEPVVCDKKTNLSKIEDYVKRAVHEDVALIVFPELSLTGYVCGTQFFDLAENVPGPTTKFISDIVAKTNTEVVLGLPEKVGHLIFNTAVLIGDGVLAKQRKLFLPNFRFGGVTYEEMMYFSTGTEINTFSSKLGKLGVEICYDFWYPEIVRAHSMQGAWLNINISAAPVGVPEFFQQLAKARALENVSTFAYVNQVGVQEGVRFGGGTCVVSHLGDIMQCLSIGEKAREEYISIELEESAVTRARLDLPILRDVRPEVLDNVSGICEKVLKG